MAQPSVDVKLDGISDELLDNALLFLSIEQQKNHERLSDARIRRLHNKATEEIRRSLEPYGYYHPHITAKLERIGDERWRASYQVDAGEPTLVTETHIQLQGDALKDTAFLNWQKNFPLQAGFPVNHLAYEESKDELIGLAAERGYFDARFEKSSIEINLDNRQAHVFINFNSGVRHDISQVRFNQDILNHALLSRYIPFEVGSPYHVSKLVELQQTLSDTDFFQSVEVNPAPFDAQNGAIPIDVRLSPRSNHIYTLGLGYGTDTGARGMLGWQIPLINRRGHRFGLKTKVSKTGDSLTAQYRIPVYDPRSDQLIFSAGLVNETTDDFSSQVITASTILNHARFGWRESVGLTYQEEEFSIASNQGRSTLLMPGIGWNRVWADKRINTRQGLGFHIQFRGTIDNPLSTTQFAQARGGGKLIQAISRRGRFIARGEAGITTSDNFHDLPASVRFYAGGASSVRGYRYQELGPKNERGENEGGQYLLVGSVEYEHKLQGKWGISGFYDVGDAMNGWAQPLKVGTGFGLRWSSPVGPVRIDLATAISEEGKPWRLHINIGPDL